MKNTLYRALKYIQFKKMKSIMLILLFTLASSMVLISSTLNTTIEAYYSQMDTTNGTSVSANRVMNFNPGSGSGPSRDELTQSITDEQLSKIAALSYVTDISQTTSVYVTNDSLEAISYDTDESSTSDTDGSTQGGPSGMDGGMMMGGSFNMGGLRLTGSSHLTLESDFSAGTVSLASGTMPAADNEIIISENLATLNELKIGDTITLSDEDAATSADYKIVGLYMYNGSLNEMTMRTVPENTMYGTFSAAEALVSGESQTMVTNIYYIDSAASFDQFETDFYRITGTDADTYELTLNDSVYQETIAPLIQLQGIIDIAKWVVIAIVIVIMATISYLMIKERTYEIGVLYSLSESKTNIIIQFVFENLILLTIGFVLAMVINYLTADTLINGLLSLELFNSVQNGANMMAGGNMPSFSGGSFNPGGEQTTTTVQASFTALGMLTSYLTTAIAVSLITILTIFRTLMKRPKEIINS